MKLFLLHWYIHGLTFCLTLHHSLAQFTDGYPPDGTPIQIIHTYKIGLTVLYDLIAVAGLVLAIACAVFNFIFRSKK